MAAVALVPTIDYFALFPGFKPDPKAPIMDEFQRLASQQGWRRRTTEYHIEKCNCMRICFERYVVTFLEEQAGYGFSIGERFARLRVVCKDLGLPLKGLTTITKCKEALKTRVHVNMLDLIDSRRQGTKVQVFQSAHALAAYTVEEKKYFPREIAKNHELSRALLRCMV